MQMAAALGPAATLLGKVFSMLSEAPVAAYVDSLELGHNSEQIKASGGARNWWLGIHCNFFFSLNTIWPQGNPARCEEGGRACGPRV